MGPKKLYSQLGYRKNEHLFDCLTAPSTGPGRLQERLSCQAEYAAYGEAASPLGAFPLLLRSTAFTWEQRHKNELDLNRLRTVRTTRLDWA